MPNAHTPETLRAFVFSRIDTSGGPEACHEWQGWRHKQGYGLVEVKDRKFFVHRLVLGWHLGHELTRDEHALHSCDNPPCLNVAHLRVGTHADNMQDMSMRGRQTVHPGEESVLAKLTNAQAEEIRVLLAEGQLYQREIAAMYGISQSTVSYIKLGQRYPSEQP